VAGGWQKDAWARWMAVAIARRHLLLTAGCPSSRALGAGARLRNPSPHAQSAGAGAWIPSADHLLMHLSFMTATYIPTHTWRCYHLFMMHLSPPGACLPACRMQAMWRLLQNRIQLAVAELSEKGGISVDQCIEKYRVCRQCGQASSAGHSCRVGPVRIVASRVGRRDMPAALGWTVHAGHRKKSTQ